MEEKNINLNVKNKRLILILIFFIIIFISISSFLLGSLTNLNKKEGVDQFIDEITKISYKNYTNEQAQINALNGLLNGLDDYSYVSKDNDIFGQDLKKLDFEFKLDKNNTLKVTNSLNSKSKIYPSDLIYGIKTKDQEFLFNDINDFKELDFIKLIKIHVKPYSDDYYLLIDRNGKKLIEKNTLKSIYEKNIEHKLIKTNNKTYLYIRFPNFIDENLIEQVENQLKEFENIKTEKELILDLKNNLGGNVLLAEDLLSLFIHTNIPAFKLSFVKNNNIYEEQDFIIKSRKKIDTNYKINIIVNERTASASELFIKVIQNFKENVYVYGKQTYGKNVFQNRTNININDQRYTLSLTLGYWKYYDKQAQNYQILDKKENKIKLIEKEFSNFSKDKNITFEKDLEYDNVDYNISVLQEYINLIYNKNFRTDGYFDTNLKDFIKDIQKENNLNITSKLDFNTFIYFYDKIKVYKSNINNYKLLNEIIKKG